MLAALTITTSFPAIAYAQTESHGDSISENSVLVAEEAANNELQTESSFVTDGLTYKINNDGTTVSLTDCDESVTQISIPKSIVYNEVEYKVSIIGSSAFNGCRNLISVKIPNSVTKIYDLAFYNCSSLKNVEIPDSVTTIGLYAFSSCISLASVEIPDSVTSIGENAFGGCKSLTSVKLSNSLTSIADDTFSNCNSLKSVEIPNSVTSIGEFSFNGCTSLTNIKIPDSVTSIGKCAFNLCEKLESVQIPSSVTSLGFNIFNECNQLEYVYYDGTKEQWEQIFVYDIRNTWNAETLTYVEPGVLDSVGAFVSRMYTVALNREAESAGLNDWTSQLVTQKIDGAGIANGFINGIEFKNRNLNDSNYLDTLYRTFFDREADAGGKSYWLNQIANGMPRNQVLAGFVNSREFSNLCDKFGIARGTMQPDGSVIYKAGVRNYVLRMYTKALNRSGETLGVEDWTNRINTKVMSAEAVAKEFFATQEFINRKLNNADYVETLYQTFMDRASDAGGKQYWVNKLNSGTSREQVLEGFSRSTEFSQIMARYGL